MKKPNKTAKKVIGFILILGIAATTFSACSTQKNQDNSVTETSSEPKYGDIVFEVVNVRTTPDCGKANVLFAVGKGMHVTPVEDMEYVYSEIDGVRFVFCQIDDSIYSGWIVADAVCLQQN